MHVTFLFAFFSRYTKTQTSKFRKVVRQHKQDSLIRDAAAFVDRGRQTTHKCYNLHSPVKMLTTRDGPAVIDTLKPDIG